MTLIFVCCLIRKLFKEYEPKHNLAKLCNVIYFLSIKNAIIMLKGSEQDCKL